MRRGEAADLTGMFADCYSLQWLDLTGFECGETTDTHSMFADCGDLILIVKEGSPLARAAQGQVKEIRAAEKGGGGTDKNQRRY